MGVTLSGSQGLSSPQANGYVGDVMIPPKKFMKVAAFGVHAVNFLMLLQRLSPAIIRFLIQEVWSWFQDVAVQSSGIVTTSRYVVPTGRVKVPAGRYVVPTGKDNVIVSAGRSKVIPAGRTILVLMTTSIVLSIEDKLNYLEQPLPPSPVAPEDNLELLGHPVTLGLAVSMILIGLHKEFDGFVQNYIMHNLGKIVNEFHAMLKLHEQILPKNNAPALHAIQYLAELLKKKKNAASGARGSGILAIELDTFLNRSWIYDTSCGTHICSTTQGLRASRKLKPGALSLYVGNGHHEAVEAISVFYLFIPSGLEIVLNNCHYAPFITKGVISVSRLYEDGFINRFVNNTIQVSRNNMVYFSAIPRDGIFEIDLSNSYENESSIYTVSNKRAKLDLDSALLWHCRLGHISKKRIKKLQHDRLLNSTDLRAFEKCVPCMSGKMARKPYTHQVERVKDLLGLINTDVCGPFKIMSRQGGSYFITFTDDFSRYGYVYLLKHKHDVFETFKVFQKQVENQLGKTIKSLHSDHGGRVYESSVFGSSKGSWDYRPLYSSLHATTQWCVKEEK
ncbi:retrotransposon protein, putative, ty1-copia subclass [Tanacetum coccineum]|uniref:Retrotransposon protein, putative, ty1-copia subclass n=2 Tax=Tanacetum coccineum TaxID=301880 RepID=A0ABQ5DFN5_9ASTR